MEKKIENIVFLKTDSKYGENRPERIARIQYDNGLVRTVSYEEGIDACKELATDLNITSKNIKKSTKI